MEMYNPCHPGEILREKTLKNLNITVTEFAKLLGVSRQAISEIVNEKRGISPQMALRLSKALGTSPDLWLRMQMSYDLWQAKQSINLDNIRLIKKTA
ncbi:MAG: addiction module antidote protein, HigA family [Candidatus Melainabacteria bacterium GWF2_37_15]|nr:MAG: addiction module antidote protein, HigA family [Candidatus Melainabacteria bacterium GWF2_37_15]